MTVKNKRLVMCGSHIGGEHIIRSLLKNGYHFSYFVLINQNTAEKNAVSGYFDFSFIAQEYNIPVHYAKSYSLKSTEDISFFEREKFDILIQGGWQRLFPSQVLDSLQIGALGFHGSSDFLPRGRGRSPMNWSIIENKKRFLMHLFLIKPGADDGDIIAVKDFDITDSDDMESMYMKYSIVNRDMILENLPALLNDSYITRPQIGSPSYYPKRTSQDGLIDWETMDLFFIERLIRAVSKPYPGARAKINGEDCIIWRARIFDTRLKYPNDQYGSVVETINKKIIVNCLGGLLLVDQYEKE